MRLTVDLLFLLLLAATPTVAASDNHHLRGSRQHEYAAFNSTLLRGGEQHHRRANEALMKRMIVTYADGQGDACKKSMYSTASTLRVEYDFDSLNAVIIGSNFKQFTKMGVKPPLEYLYDIPLGDINSDY